MMAEQGAAERGDASVGNGEVMAGPGDGEAT